MNTNPILMTQTGLDALQTELANLLAQRPHKVDRLSVARSMGDLSENSDYHSAKDDLAFSDGRVAELEDLIRNAQIIAPSANNQVNVGHAVTVQVGANKVVFQIVGEFEADPSARKVSHSSPLGQALLGKKVGDKVEVEAPAGRLVYTIVGIE